MEKRFIAFIVLSFLIMAAWQLIIGRFYPAKPSVQNTVQNTATQPQQKSSEQKPTELNPPQINAAPNNAESVQPAASTAEPNTQPQSASAVPPRSIAVETPLWRAVFDNRGAVLKSIDGMQLPNGRKLVSGDYTPLELVMQQGAEKTGSPLRLEAVENPDLTKRLNESYYNADATADTITVGKGEQKELAFTFEDASGLKIQKRFRFFGGEYVFDTTIDASINGQPLKTTAFIGPNFGDQSVKKIDGYISTPQQIMVERANGKVKFLTGNDLQHRNAPPDAKKEFNENINWVAATDHYFAMAVVPSMAVPKVSVRNDFYKETVDGKEIYKNQLSLEFPVLNNEPYQIYVGPKDRNMLQEANNHFKGRVDLENLVDYGIFSIVVRPLMPILDILLKVFFKATHNYGWSIIILTFIINMFFFPLKWKSSVAMKKAVKMQPKMKEIQEKIKKLKKDDPRLQQLQLEQMKLMKDGNPLAGCLPMLLQMPIFWAFFIFLSISIDVRHSPFIFWINDLSAPDKTWILPIIMTGSMMASTALTPAPNDPQQKMQRMLTAYVMPIVFMVLFFVKAPSGLVLYWMFGNIIGVVQQLIINKMTAEPPDPGAATNTDKKTEKADKLSSDDKNRTQTGDLANVR